MNVKNIIEVLFHSSPSPLSQKDLNHVLGDNKIKIEDIVGEINAEYQSADKGLVIEKISGGYQLLSKKEYHFYIEKLLKEIKKPRFSSAAMETLSIVAYKQPVTRIEVESILDILSS